MFRPMSVIPNTVDPALKDIAWKAIEAMFEDCLAYEPLHSSPSLLPDTDIPINLFLDLEADVALTNLIGAEADVLAAEWAETDSARKKLAAMERHLSGDALALVLRLQGKPPPKERKVIQQVSILDKARLAERMKLRKTSMALKRIVGDTGDDPDSQEKEGHSQMALLYFFGGADAAPRSQDDSHSVDGDGEQDCDSGLTVPHVSPPVALPTPRTSSPVEPVAPHVWSSVMKAGLPVPRPSGSRKPLEQEKTYSEWFDVPSSDLSKPEIGVTYEPAGPANLCTVPSTAQSAKRPRLPSPSKAQRRRSTSPSRSKRSRMAKVVIDLTHHENQKETVLSHRTPPPRASAPEPSMQPTPLLTVRSEPTMLPEPAKRPAPTARHLALEETSRPSPVACSSTARFHLSTSTPLPSMSIQRSVLSSPSRRMRHSLYMEKLAAARPDIAQRRAASLSHVVIPIMASATDTPWARVVGAPSPSTSKSLVVSISHKTSNLDAADSLPSSRTPQQQKNRTRSHSASSKRASASDFTQCASAPRSLSRLRTVRAVPSARERARERDGLASDNSFHTVAGSDDDAVDWARVEALRERVERGVRRGENVADILPRLICTNR
jgi:hypothetical protein